MSVEAVIIGEMLVSVLMLFREKAIAAGVAEEEADKMLADAMAKVKASKPEDLPVR